MSSASRPRAAVWRAVLKVVLTAGWLYGRAVRPLRLRRRYRRAGIGPLSFRVPVTWGEFEPAPEGDFVLRSVPTRDFVYGDALWYANVAEIRVRPPEGRLELPAEAPMDEARRTIETPDGPLLVLLRVARGMSSGMRAEAERALRSARLRRASGPLDFPTPTYGRPALPDGRPPLEPRMHHLEGR